MANADMDVAHHPCVVGHLMNNSYRLGKPVPFNAKAGKFGDNKDAYEHFMKLHEIMRDGSHVSAGGALVESRFKARGTTLISGADSDEKCP